MATRAGAVNVVDQRACAWRRLSQKGAGGRWAWARRASALRARGSGRRETQLLCQRELGELGQADEPASLEVRHSEL